MAIREEQQHTKDANKPGEHVGGAVMLASCVPAFTLHTAVPERHASIDTRHGQRARRRQSAVRG